MSHRTTRCFGAVTIVLIAMLTNQSPGQDGQDALTVRATAVTAVEAVESVQPRMVKVYGAGGIAGLESHQSGVLISSDGHVLTAHSYVLDTDDDEVSVYLNDGREFVGRLMGYDPSMELAVLKIEATGLPHFDVSQSVSLTVGDRILAFSNLYGIASGNEPTSVLHGSVSALTQMAGRRGAFDTPYKGPIYVLDAITNNAGAAGGVITNHRGELAGIIGKELRSSENNLWLNYALPIDAIREAIPEMMAGKSRPREGKTARVVAKRPWSHFQMGALLIPDVLPKTPPFVEAVVPNSPAARAGLRPDDLVLYVGKTMIRSQREWKTQLMGIEDEDALELVVLRDKDLVPLTIEPE